MKVLLNKVLFTTSDETIIEAFLQPGVFWSYAYAISNMDKISKDLKDKATVKWKGCDK